MTVTLEKKVETPQRAFRLDIQGLRAVAVMLVVLYHLWPDHLTGGFIGVDIFFVISGYLITAHLLGEVAKTGTISLTKFWARRIRRLLPASFLVLLFTLVVSVTILPESLRQQSLSEIAASAVYGLNWLLAFNAVDYLAAENTPSLVQHFWTLSVEEQFYIVWPLLALLAIWIATKMRKHDARRVIVWVFATVFVASFIASVWLTNQEPAAAYFVTHTRAWEFAAGGLAAMIPIALTQRLGGSVGTWLSWVGLGLILVPGVLYTSETPFPGWTAAVPVAGTVMLLLIGDQDSPSSPQYFAKAGPVQFVGDVSYAIYLWHWPLIIAAPFIVNGNVTATMKVGILALTLVLAFASQKLVEDPLRSSRGLLGTRRAAYSFMAAGMVIIVATSLIFAWAFRPDTQKLEEAINDSSGCFGHFAIVNECDDPYAVTETVSPAYSIEDTTDRYAPLREYECVETTLMNGRSCEIGATNPTATIALIGDSHADHLLPPLLDIAERENWRIIVRVKSSCSMFERPLEIGRADIQERHDTCVTMGERTRAELAERDDIDLVLLSSDDRANHVDTDTIAADLRSLIDDGANIALLSDIVGHPNTRAPTCVEAQIDRGVTNDPCVVERPAAGPATKAALEVGVPVIDLESQQCDDTTCHLVIGGTIVFHDRGHFAVAFARTLAPWLENEITLLLPNH